ncbi:hypothetical protein KQI61_06195 [Anaerocolumna aminovalerica]|uniref:hypothetical protein n=1 Tax=Anaerocolumna aminovalerica TaxID=1527 RepID=UPI001C0F0D25|nr:hypothetical protein [Anaerocolumna aminovalerica]MBU5331781.1 hypothetical protein [Anaerocolumna aminovalerica]
MRHKDDACMDVAYCSIGESYKIKIIKMKKNNRKAATRQFLSKFERRTIKGFKLEEFK